MKAWQYSVVKDKLEDALSTNNDAKQPQVQDLSGDQYIIEVLVAGLNPVDYKMPESAVVGKMMIGRPATPAMDFCGRIYGKSSAATTFEIGQVVFGGLDAPSQIGACGEFLIARADQIAALPPSVKPATAAAIGTAATTAYQSLMPATLPKGSKVLINGASGGCGTWAIQFACILGLSVTAICSTANVELCRELGASEVIDYKRADVNTTLEKGGNVYDMAIDMIAGSTSNLFPIASKFLKQGGRFVQVGTQSTINVPEMLCIFSRSLRPTRFSAGGIEHVFIKQSNKTEYFEQIGQWVSEGKAKALVQEVVPFDQVPRAFAKLRSGRTRGKILVEVKPLVDGQ